MMTDMMTQEEINKMMRESSKAAKAEEDEFYLNNTEKDAIGEVSNICMGTCATTLSTLLNKRVNITTPKVTLGKIDGHLEEFKTPFVAVGVEYTEGISGYNIFILKQNDVLLMTDLLMGGEGNIDPNAELDELAFSAISEVMNQMVGSSSTALADVIGRQINISVPNVKKVELGEPDISEFIHEDDVTIKISFVMEIEDLLVSNIMQIIPFENAKEILAKILPEEELGMAEESAPAPQAEASRAPAPAAAEPARGSSIVGVKKVQYESFDGVTGRTPFCRQ